MDKLPIGTKLLCIRESIDSIFWADAKVGKVFTLTGYHPVSFTYSGKYSLGFCFKESPDRWYPIEMFVPFYELEDIEFKGLP